MASPRPHLNPVPGRPRRPRGWEGARSQALAGQEVDAAWGEWQGGALGESPALSAHHQLEELLGFSVARFSSFGDRGYSAHQGGYESWVNASNVLRIGDTDASSK